MRNNVVRNRGKSNASIFFKPGTINSGDYVTIFVDASYCDKTHSMGWAGWCKYGECGKNITCSGTGKAANSTKAELTGLIKMINFVIESGVSIKNKKVVIQCDNINALETYKHDRLYELGAKNVKFKHVKAHTNGWDRRSKVNDWCDAQAKEALNRSRNEHVGR